jgi:hypothetical protein
MSQVFLFQEYDADQQITGAGIKLQRMKRAPRYKLEVRRASVDPKEQKPLIVEIPISYFEAMACELDSLLGEMAFYELARQLRSKGRIYIEDVFQIPSQLRLLYSDSDSLEIIAGAEESEIEGLRLRLSFSSGKVKKTIALSLLDGVQISAILHFNYQEYTQRVAASDMTIETS